MEGENVIWLPPEHRRFTCFALEDATLAMGYYDGRGIRRTIGYFPFELNYSIVLCWLLQNRPGRLSFIDEYDMNSSAGLTLFLDPEVSTPRYGA